MIPTVAIAAISLGIQLSSHIISFIVGQSSKEEIEKQLEIQNEIKKVYEAREKSIDEMKKSFSSEIADEYQKERIRQENILKSEAKKDILDLVHCKVEERIKYVNEILLKDIDEALNKLKEQRIQYNSSLRCNSLVLLKSELYEAKNKAQAYKTYLNRYDKYLESIYDCCENEPDFLFSFTLPKEFPYNNKIILLSSDDFNHENGIGTVTIHGCMRIDFYITDYDFFKNDVLNNIVTMQTGFDESNHRHIYSIQHGRYKQIAKSGGFTGITAKVTGYSSDKNTILLTYGKNMNLDLNIKNLYNFQRYPVIGSEITVFPLYETYSPKEKRVIYRVSQRQEDSEISLNFKEIPLILPKCKAEEFVNYYLQNKVNLECDDVKVAPISETEMEVLNPTKLKLQFGEQYTIIVEVKSKLEKQYLWFKSFITDQRLSPDNIFIPFNAKIDVLNEKDYESFSNDSSHNEVFENMNNLVLTIFSEFNLQYKLKNSQDGMRYFSAWENIVGSLRKYCEKSEPFTCKIEKVPQIIEKKHGCILKFKVSNPEMLKRYYENILSKQNNDHYNCEFFIEHNKTYYAVEINPNCETFNILIPVPEGERTENENEIINQIELLSEIVIYKKNYGVPEQRQLQALHNFKVGSLCNRFLQMYMLNGKCIRPSYDSKEISELYNKRLQDNHSQYNSLLRSLNENNIFFIQGPPGTGKTTVIRELIAQTLKHSPSSKVLIVSQANVAVDNVIKGLISDDMPFKENDIIRCGRSGKISPEIANMSYEKKYTDYISSIKNLSVNASDNEIRKLSTTWLNKIQKNSRYNPDVGELIIKNHKIIGATCVGLSQKGIGIDKLMFDLVIIDEAGKALAPEIVIPMLRAKKAVIIGDHKQLPAVINPALYDEEKIELDERQYCKKEIFDISYFQKLYESCPDENKSLLDTQYRMPDIIGTMISELFYDGQLKNGDGTSCKKPIYSNSNLTIIDMSYEKQYLENDKSSPFNEYEAKYVLYLLKDIKNKCTNAKIAVITPYKGQKSYIRRFLLNNDFDYREKNVYIDTVDSFQGDEADIVIYCTTRSKKKTRFLSDRRRINVAISRARNEFIMIASATYLEGYSNKEPIKKVLNYIRSHGSVIHPAKIKETNNIITKEIIRISDLMIDERVADRVSITEKINNEIKQFNQHGHFSCFPLVEKINDFFFLIKNEEIYYAAIELSLSEIFVEFSELTNVTSLKSNLQSRPNPIFSLS